MKQPKVPMLALSASTLAMLLATSVASATETVYYPPQFCVTNASHSYSAGTSVSYLESSGNASIQCPFVSMTTNSSFSDADVWTSSGVTNTEVRLREYEPAAGGDFIASYTPSTTVTGGVADHDWNTVTPTSLNYLVIFIDGAPNDRVYGYKFTDTALSY